MRAILHIGAEKTGTSSIQLFLHRNRKILSKNGYHLLQSPGERNHWLLPACCTEYRKLSRLFLEAGASTAEQSRELTSSFLQRFDEELAGLSASIHTVLITSEHLHSRLTTEEDVAQLQSLLSSRFDQVEIIYYLREQAATCASLYSTILKGGGTHSFASQMSRCTPDNYYFNHELILDNWAKHFGLESLQVGLFDRSWLRNGDLLEDFAARLDPSLIDILDKRLDKQNESLSPGGQLLCLGVNRAFANHAELPNADEIRLECRNHLYQTMKGKGQQPTPSERARIFEAFAPSNERVREKFFPDLPSLFAKPSTAPSPEFEIDAEFLGSLTSLTRKMAQNAGQKLSPHAYSKACATIFSAVTYPDLEVENRDDGAMPVWFSQADAELLKRAAPIVEIADVKDARRLFTLSHSSLPGSTPDQAVKQRLWAPPKSAHKRRYFMLAYFFNPSGRDLRTVLEVGAQMQEWTGSIAYAGDVPMQTLKNWTSVGSTGDSGEPAEKLVGYSIVRAVSLEAALAIAQECPCRDYMRIEVSRMEPNRSQNDTATPAETQESD